MGLEGCPLSFTDHDVCNKARPKNDNNNGDTAKSTATVKTPICQALGRGMGLEGCPLSFSDHDPCNKARPKNDDNNGRNR